MHDRSPTLTTTEAIIRSTDDLIYAGQNVARWTSVVRALWMHLGLRSAQESYLETLDEEVRKINEAHQQLRAAHAAWVQHDTRETKEIAA